MEWTWHAMGGTRRPMRNKYFFTYFMVDHLIGNGCAHTCWHKCGWHKSEERKGECRAVKEGVESTTSCCHRDALFPNETAHSSSFSLPRAPLKLHELLGLLSHMSQYPGCSGMHGELLAVSANSSITCNGDTNLCHCWTFYDSGSEDLLCYNTNRIGPCVST